MWIKICGTTNLEDALHAVEAGADALGFVFAESPRRVNAAELSAITPHLPAAIDKFGVFVDAGFEEIVRTITESGLTGVQLHGSDDPLLPSRLREHFGRALRILHVLHYSHDFGKKLNILGQNQAIDAVLVDSRTATAVGGTGTRFDWQAARQSFQDSQSRVRLIAAGGLSPENVAEAIRTLQPWGVDVVSGVESSPGKKDPARVKAFVNATKTAAEKIAATTQ
jgi:phosphoribosylanthranilate isomerase